MMLNSEAIITGILDIRSFLVNLFRMAWCGFCVVEVLLLLQDIWQAFHDPFYAEHIWKPGGSEIWGYSSRAEYVTSVIYTILMLLPGAVLGIYWKKVWIKRLFLAHFVIITAWIVYSFPT